MAHKAVCLATSPHSFPVYCVDDIRHIEHNAIMSGRTEEELILQASRSLLCWIDTYLPDINVLYIYCGPGKNGEDGRYLAKCARQKGFEVYLDIIPDIFPDHSLLVDALFGIGLNRAIQDPYYSLISRLNALDIPILAVDCPSGLCCDTGLVTSICIKATYTVTFIGPKKGFFLGEACHYLGEVYVDTLQLEGVSSIYTLSVKETLSLLPPLQRTAHKGTMGHTLIIGGRMGMAGAGILAAESALVTGVGKVTLVTDRSNFSAINVRTPEIMTIDILDIEAIKERLSHVQSVVIGPGLGESEESKRLLCLVFKSNCRKIIDADALTLLSKLDFDVDLSHAILTPHPGEASRLLQCSSTEIESDRFDALMRLQKRYNCSMLLKGWATLLALDDGLFINPYGNPGMAKGGFGDCLSGLLGGFLAQSLPFDDAVKIAVILHSYAADSLSDTTHLRCIQPRFLPDMISKLLNSLLVV